MTEQDSHASTNSIALNDTVPRKESIIGDAAATKQFTSDAASGKPSTSNAESGKQSTSNAALGKQSTSDAASGKQSTSDVASGKQSISDAASGKQSTSNAASGKQSTSDAAPIKQSTSNAASGKQPTSDAASGKQPTSDAASGKQPTSDAAPIKQSTSNAASGKQPISDAAPIQQSTTSNAASGKQSTTSNAASGKQSTTSNAAPRKQSISDAVPGKQSTTSNAAPGKQSTTSNAAPRKQSISDAAPGKQSTTSNAAPGKQSITDAAPRKQSISDAAPRKQSTKSHTATGKQRRQSSTGNPAPSKVAQKNEAKSKAAESKVSTSKVTTRPSNPVLRKESKFRASQRKLSLSKAGTGNVRKSSTRNTTTRHILPRKAITSNPVKSNISQSKKVCPSDTMGRKAFTSNVKRRRATIRPPANAGKNNVPSRCAVSRQTSTNDVVRWNASTRITEPRTTSMTNALTRTTSTSLTDPRKTVSHNISPIKARSHNIVYSMTPCNFDSSDSNTSLSDFESIHTTFATVSGFALGLPDAKKRPKSRAFASERFPRQYDGSAPDLDGVATDIAAEPPDTDPSSDANTENQPTKQSGQNDPNQEQSLETLLDIVDAANAVDEDDEFGEVDLDEILWRNPMFMPNTPSPAITSYPGLSDNEDERDDETNYDGDSDDDEEDQIRKRSRMSGEGQQGQASSPVNPPPSPINYSASFSAHSVGQKATCPERADSTPNIYSRDFNTRSSKTPMRHCSKCEKILTEPNTESRRNNIQQGGVDDDLCHTCIDTMSSNEDYSTVVTKATHRMARLQREQELDMERLRRRSQMRYQELTQMMNTLSNKEKTSILAGQDKKKYLAKGAIARRFVEKMRERESCSFSPNPATMYDIDNMSLSPVTTILDEEQPIEPYKEPKSPTSFLERCHQESIWPWCGKLSDQKKVKLEFMGTEHAMVRGKPLSDSLPPKDTPVEIDPTSMVSPNPMQEQNVQLFNSPEQNVQLFNSPEEDVRLVNSPEEDMRLVNSPEEDVRFVNIPEQYGSQDNMSEQYGSQVNIPEQYGSQVNMPEQYGSQVNMPEQDLTRERKYLSINQSPMFPSTSQSLVSSSSRSIRALGSGNSTTNSTSLMVPGCESGFSQWVSFNGDNEPILNNSPNVDDGCDTFLKRMQRVKVNDQTDCLPAGQKFCFEAVVDKRYNRWKRRRRKRQSESRRHLVASENSDTSGEDDDRNEAMENLLDDVYVKIHGPVAVSPAGVRDTPRRRRQSNKASPSMSISGEYATPPQYVPSPVRTTSIEDAEYQPDSRLSTPGKRDKRSPSDSCSDTNDDLWPYLDAYKEEMMNHVQATPSDQLDTMEWLPELRSTYTSDHAAGSQTSVVRRTNNKEKSADEDEKIIYEPNDMTRINLGGSPLCLMQKPVDELKDQFKRLDVAGHTVEGKKLVSKAQESKEPNKENDRDGLDGPSTTAQFNPLTKQQTTPLNRKTSLQIQNDRKMSPSEAPKRPATKEKQVSTVVPIFANVTPSIRQNTKALYTTKKQNLGLPIINEYGAFSKDRAILKSRRNTITIQDREKISTAEKGKGRRASISVLDPGNIIVSPGPERQTPPGNSKNFKKPKCLGMSGTVVPTVTPANDFLRSFHGQASKSKLNTPALQGNKLNKTVTTEHTDLSRRKSNKRYDPDIYRHLPFTRSFTFSTFDLPEIYKSHNNTLEKRAKGAS